MGGRRGGSARAAWGAWQSGEGSSAQQRAVEEVPRDAWGAWQAGGGLGAAQRDGRHGDTPAALNREAERETGDEDRDLNTISKISRT